MDERNIKGSKGERGIWREGKEEDKEDRGERQQERARRLCKGSYGTRIQWTRGIPREGERG